MAAAKYRRWSLRKAALVGYGILNAVLYASLLPLWEGFDEPFHYSYVEHLAETRSLPQVGKAHLSAEVWQSLHLAPGADAVKRNLPWVTTYGEYFRLPPDSRARVRAELDQLHGGGGWSNAPNYEAQHPPLAYAILAVADRCLAPLSLPVRIWLLRLLCGISAVLLTAAATFSLARQLGLPRHAQSALVFLTFSSQMFYATTAHVANDWLATPLVLMLVDRCVALQRRPELPQMAAVMAALACGLLTKAYLLAFVPVVAVLFARCAASNVALVSGVGATFCGPWYVRNLILYGSLTGMQEGDVHLPGLLSTAVRVPWATALKRSLFEGLWSGNNSFTAFSSGTLWLLIAGMAVMGGLYIARIRRGITAAERVIQTCITLFGGAILYYIVLSYQASGGMNFTSSPWYTAPLTPLVLTLFFLGAERYRRAGRAVVVWLIWLSAYIILATYWAKLIPLYGGFIGERTTLAELIRWYTSSADTIAFNLTTTVPAGARAIAALLALLTVAAPCLALDLTIESGYEASPDSARDSLGGHGI